MFKTIKKQAAIELKTFLKYADAFYLSIGLVVYDRDDMINLNFVLLTELIYVFLAIKSGTNFLEATMNLSFIGFVIVGDLKIWLIYRQRTQLTRVIRQLQKLHPTDIEGEKSFGVADYFSNYKHISIFYFGMHLVLIWTYNLYWAVYYLIYDFWLGRVKFERMLPYYSWLPWDWSKHWSYYVLYVSQNLGGQACLSGQLSADLLMCALVTLLVMHFRLLGRKIEAHVAGIGSVKADLLFLQTAVAYHERVLEICQTVNEIFGVSLLCNFLSSSFIICFVGFHMTIGGKVDSLVMLMLFLFCAMVQVFMISNYAQRLLDASEYIGKAAYNHIWFQADLSYRKMLVLIIKRAQDPSRLKATSFLSISLVTMTELLQLSYKFFALLRQMYVN